jgi:hypothetical protein
MAAPFIYWIKLAPVGAEGLVKPVTTQSTVTETMVKDDAAPFVGVYWALIV